MRPFDARIGAVGAAFLRARPLIVAPVAALNVTALLLGGAPVAQRLALGASSGAMLAFFSAEALHFRRRHVPERWLGFSLGLTLVGLSLACAMSGGLASPLVPLVGTPVVVAFAAFGRRRVTATMLVTAIALAAGLACLPAGVPFATLSVGTSRWMTLASFAGSIALSFAGVAGLVEAHAKAASDLERMRNATLEEAASRVRATEQIGARVAHELKNPLAAVRSLVQSIGRGERPERTTDRVDVVLGEIDRMDGIVRDYLAFARPLADLEPRRVDVLEIARDVVAVLEARAADARVRLDAEGASVTISADPRRVREALLNLATNALAATPATGTVTLATSAYAGGARIDVIDTGSGIPADVATASGPAISRTLGGTGLGIAIARSALRQHGGDLVFERTEGGGTIARVTLPGTPSPRGASLATEVDT